MILLNTFKGIAAIVINIVIIIASSFLERVPTNGTRGIDLQPGVNAISVKVVAALRHHPQHLRFLVILNTYGAGGIMVAHRCHTIGFAVRESVVRLHDIKG